ncbi:hypothetical protein GTCCBUS3UF5_4140 [Geobacillus thermoleovorans CCB_US3_UF5]|uniref:Uncharacterized protein n=1 Tax=Geobacillus thermoleovorans CCB_US3_UF5 TaxID=1111068 RepID=A0ABM5MDJ8_GEOTH|nr:hypothetical protein GTCCBUS3UF5_4140 [Geobacillus thermoleovorans CCB_US3_UF5]
MLPNGGKRESGRATVGSGVISLNKHHPPCLPGKGVIYVKGGGD